LWKCAAEVQNDDLRAFRKACRGLCRWLDGSRRGTLRTGGRPFPQGDQSLLRKHQARTREWSRLIGITGGAQFLVQGLGFVAGILIVRRLPIAEYAYYTIATALLSTMTALADGGIGAGVISQGGKVWKDPVELGKVVASGLALRRRFALLSAVAVPFLIYFLRKHGASWRVWRRRFWRRSRTRYWRLPRSCTRRFLRCSATRLRRGLGERY